MASVCKKNKNFSFNTIIPFFGGHFPHPRKILLKLKLKEVAISRKILKWDLNFCSADSKEMLALRMCIDMWMGHR